jgi:heme A synthase
LRLSSLFRLTALAIFVQIALGGLLTFGFIDPLPHIAIGLIVVALAVVTSTISLRSKLPDKQLKEVSIALIAALVVQVILGFATLALSSSIVGWVHLLVGVITYAIALTGMSFAQRQEYMSKAGQPREQRV